MLSLVLAAQLLTAAPTQLTLEVKPDGVEVKLDGNKVGKSGEKAMVKTVKPGKHVVRLSYKGDSHEEEVSVKAGEKKTWSFTFDTGAPSAPTDEKAATE